jgi:hypothetical protein
VTTSRFIAEATACALAVALMFLAWTWPALSRGENTVDNAIIFLADTSASMDEDEKQTVRKSHATAISSPEVIDAILSGGYQRSVFAYVEFADNAVIVVDWTLIASQADAIAFADRITNGTGPKAKGSNTAIGSALAVAHELMQRLSYEALYRTVDVAGDGLSNYGAPVTIARSLLLDMGVTAEARRQDAGGILQAERCGRSPVLLHRASRHRGHADAGAAQAAAGDRMT